MDHPSTKERTNGAELPSLSPVPSCPLCEYPENLHQYIFALESRIKKLEDEQTRLFDSIKNLGTKFYENPTLKAFLSVLPKSMQESLKEAFSGNR